MPRSILTLLLVFGAGLWASAQRTLTGTVNADDGAPLVGVNIFILGQRIGTVTDIEGKYETLAPEGATFATFALSGYNTLEVPIGTVARLDVTLTRGVAFDDLVTTGTSAVVRTALSSSSPIEVIYVRELYAHTGHSDLNGLLTFASPSFTANPQVLSGASDFVDPASLRGLGPDQMLVLVNGKRRHKSALLNLSQAFGRGTAGTDLNAIPIAAVERVEILRDGATAQYGSDAVAGVINVILKENIGLSAGAIGGVRLSEGVTTQTAAPSALDRYDGAFSQVSANYGLRLGRRGGVLNLTALGDIREPTSRVQAYTGRIFSGYNDPSGSNLPTDDITEAELVRRGLTRADFNSRVGQAAVRNASAFGNLSLPLGSSTELYGFGGANYRLGETKGRFALPNAAGTVTDLYPNGVLPEINAVIVDEAATVGLRRSLGAWELDLSHAFGRNAIDLEVNNSNNASLQGASPIDFAPGGFAFAQNTTTLGLRRYFPATFAGLTLALGAEHRQEYYRVTAGEEASYRDYGAARIVSGPNGEDVVVLDEEGAVAVAFDPIGRRRPAGVQGFAGIRPEDAGSSSRQSFGGYADAELDLTRRLMLRAAGRYERYSDAGNALAGQLSARLLVNRELSIRASANTGYRAPSLPQTGYSASARNYVGEAPTATGVFGQGSAAAQALGIDDLKLERHQSYSFGGSGRLADGLLGLAADVFQLEISDRAILTAPFGADAERRDIAALLRQAGATEASFFASAVDTRTRGVEGRGTYYASWGGGRLRLESSLGGTVAFTEVSRVRASQALLGAEDIYLTRASRSLIERSVPSRKAHGSVRVTRGKFEFFGRGVFFGYVREAAASERLAQNLNGRQVFDLSFSYRTDSSLRITLGANNVLDAYPERLNPANTQDGSLVYSNSTQQFGAGGRFVFLRVSLGM